MGWALTIILIQEWFGLFGLQWPLTVRYLVCLTVVFNGELATAICSHAPFPDSIDFRQYLPSVNLMPHPGDTLLESYGFGCRGRITQWEAHTSGEGAHPIEFQVWRARVEIGEYELIGTNTFPNATPTGNILRLKVSEDEQINVNPGEFIGVRTTLGTERNGFQIQTITGTIIKYDLMGRETPNPLSISINGIRNQFPTNLDPISQRINFTPLINAVVSSKYTIK